MFRPPFSRSHVVALLGALALLSPGVALAQESSAAGSRGTGGGTALQFDRRHVTFEDRFQGETVEQRWTFVNTSDGPVELRSVRRSVAGADVQFSPAILLPGASGELRVRQSLGGRLGKVSFRYALVTSDSEELGYRVSLSGFAQSAYDPETISLDFGRVDRSEGGSVDFLLDSREIPRLELVAAESTVDAVGVTVVERTGEGERGLVLLAALEPGAPEGYLAGALTLQTNVAHHPAMTVGFRAVVVGDVSPSENPIDLGAVEQGSGLQHPVILRSRSGTPFRVARVEDDGGRITVEVTPCPEAETVDACHLLDLQLQAGDDRNFAGNLFVHLVDRKDDPIRLRYQGIVVRPGTQIRDLKIGDSVGTIDGSEPGR